ncbi:MAG: hypothetical protein WBG71_04915 [Leeuwenhoekiella sp.]
MGVETQWQAIIIDFGPTMFLDNNFGSGSGLLLRTKILKRF